MNKNILRAKWQVQSAINATLLQIESIANDEEYNDWLLNYKKTNAAEEDILKDLLESNKVVDLPTEKSSLIELESLKAEKDILEKYLNDCDDETEGYLLNRLIELKKDISNIDSKVKNINRKNKLESTAFPSTLQALSEDIVENEDYPTSIEQVIEPDTISKISRLSGFDEETCRIELNGLVREIISRVADKIINHGTAQDDEIIDVKSEHFHLKFNCANRHLSFCKPKTYRNPKVEDFKKYRHLSNKAMSSYLIESMARVSDLSEDECEQELEELFNLLIEYVSEKDIVGKTEHHVETEHFHMRAIVEDGEIKGVFVSPII